MSDYSFYCAQLRYFARTTERISPEISAMMDLLADIANQIEQRGAYTITPPDHRLAARALAGIAGLLQTHVLPEVIAAANARGEQQVRWTIDRSMEAMTALMAHADGGADTLPKTIDLPQPPMTESTVQ